jgi:hypothetical protein
MIWWIVGWIIIGWLHVELILRMNGAPLPESQGARGWIAVLFLLAWPVWDLMVLFIFVRKVVTR